MDTEDTPESRAYAAQREMEEYQQFDSLATDEASERALLERAIANARNGIIITDNRQVDNPIVYYNAAFGQLTGYDRDEIIGHNCRFLQGPDTAPEAKRALRDAIGRGEGIHLEVLNYRKDGTPFWNNLLVSPMRDRDGRVTHFVGNQIDVTARKEAEFALAEERNSLERRVQERTIALAQQRDESQAIAETVREPLLVLDEDFRVSWANRAFYATFRTKPEDTEGEHLFSLGNGQWDIPQLHELLEQILPEHTAFDDFEVEHVFPGIGRRIMHLNARQISLRGEGRRQILLAMEDVTARTRAARISMEQSVLTNAILTSLPAHIAVLRHDGTIIAVNEAWDRFAMQGGVPTENGAYLGVNYLDTLRRATGESALEAPLALEGIERVLQRQQAAYSLEYPCDIPDKGQAWFMLQAVPLRQDDGGAVVMHLDITERKLIEQRKDDFISMASHELKTPVTSLQLGAQILQRRLERLDLSEEARSVERLRSQISRLSRLVEELLDVSRINVGKLDIVTAPVDLIALIRETIELLQFNAPDHAIELSSPESLVVDLDRDRIAQVLINLISNAIKYSPAGSPVEVAVERIAGAVALSVRDQGMGISPEFQARIFDRFYQVPAPPGHAYPGLGMGLHIASEIIKRHGGSIWVDSSQGAGATFRCTLPIDTSEEAA